MSATIQELLSVAVSRLRMAGVGHPGREARLLLAEACELPIVTILAWPERMVEPAPVTRFAGWMERRLAGEPISRILGRREFWSLPFIVTPATLDPRPDSETVIEAALDLLRDRDRPYRFLDFGTGTGCLLLALLSEYSQAWGLGIDRCEAAAAVAAANAKALGLDERARFAVADWDAALAGTFDLIVANPPYIPSAEIAGLMPAVRDFDPRGALDGGLDGLDPYRHLAAAAPRLLRPDGAIVFEVGDGQAEAVSALLKAAGSSETAIRRDLGGVARTVSARSLGALQK